MIVLSGVAWGLAALVTLLWILAIRDGVARDNSATPEMINTGLLFVLLLAGTALARLPGLHLLWLFPLAWFVGQRSGRPPLSLLDHPGGWFFWLITRGLRRR